MRRCIASRQTKRLPFASNSRGSNSEESSYFLALRPRADLPMAIRG